MNHTISATFIMGIMIIVIYLLVALLEVFFLYIIWKLYKWVQASLINLSAPSYKKLFWIEICQQAVYESMEISFSLISKISQAFSRMCEIWPPLKALNDQWLIIQS